MANSTKPIVTTQAAAVAANAVTPTVLVPDNCHTIIMLNTSTTIPVLYGQELAGTVLVEGTNSSRLPASGALSLAIGTLKQRGYMNDTVTGPCIVFQGVGGAANVDITYLCGFGSL